MSSKLGISKPKRRQIRDFYQGQVVFLNDGDAPSPTPYHQCHYCKRYLGSEQALESHHDSFHKEIVCTACPGGLAFPNKSEWRQHVAKVHPDRAVGTGDVFPCDECARVLTSEVNLTAHKKSFHLKVPCFICGMEVVGMNKRRHMVKYHLKRPDEEGKVMARKEREQRKLMEREMRKQEQKEMKKRRNEEKLKQKAMQRRERLERALLETKLASLQPDPPKLPPISSSNDFAVNLKQNVVTVPMHFPISEVWYSPVSADEVPLAVLDDDSNLVFDPFLVDHCQHFVKQIFEGPDSFASDNDNSVQVEFVDEVEIVDEKNTKEVVFENLMLWSDGEISVVAEEVVVENPPENATKSDPAKETSQKCFGCGKNFFLDLDFQLHYCEEVSTCQDEDGGALVLPIQQELNPWEHSSKFGI